MAGLPAANSEWPNADWALAYAQYDENNAWYSDDQVALNKVYGSLTGQGRNRGDSNATHYNKSDNTFRAGGLRGRLSRMFNGEIVGGKSGTEQRTRIHAPVASNLATLSADLLMAESPTFRLVGRDGKPYKGKATERIDDIMNSPATHRALYQAAELTAGLSATVLTAHWDPAVSDKPWLQSTSCDAAIPEFANGGRLKAVNLYTMHIVSTGPIADEVYIHIERHESGNIIHALYKTRLGEVGGHGALGALVPLETLEELAHIPRVPGSVAGPLDLTVALPTGIRALTASWWRNLPTKTFRKYGSQLSMMGRADFEGVEQLLDAIDEVWSSWMRDIKIARARLIVPETFLEMQGPGLGGAFDDAQEILTPLAFTDLSGDDSQIQAHQFEIRYQEHMGTLLGLTKEITQFAGYSMASYGERSDAGSLTATEIVDRTTMTERTRDKKFLYFDDAAEPITVALMELDARHYGGTAIPAEATLDIKITELSQVDPEKEARTIQYIRAAQAASTATLVRMQHPDWEEKEILEEIALVRQEAGLDVEADPAQEGRVQPKLDEDGNPIPADDVEE